MDKYMLSSDILRLLRQIRFLIVILITGLIASGITAFPIQWELEVAHRWTEKLQMKNSITQWLETVHKAVHETSARYPFISYGTDWLAYAHLVIAIAFIGPWRDPVKNIWVIEFGLIACAGIFPLALIAGSLRDIPLFWQAIDCSFGMAGAAILLVCYKKIRKLSRLQTVTHGQ